MNASCQEPPTTHEEMQQSIIATCADASLQTLLCVKRSLIQFRKCIDANGYRFEQLLP
jgi:hypothetical protein